MQNVAIHTFHSGTTDAASNGVVYRNIYDATTLNVTIIASSTFTATFEVLGEGDATNWKPIVACNLGTLAIASTATDDGYVYQIDITAINSIRVRLSSNAGTVTCVGKAVG